MECIDLAGMVHVLVLRVVVVLACCPKPAICAFIICHPAFALAATIFSNCWRWARGNEATTSGGSAAICSISSSSCVRRVLGDAAAAVVAAAAGAALAAGAAG